MFCGNALSCATCGPGSLLVAPRQVLPNKWHAPCYLCGMSHELEPVAALDRRFRVLTEQTELAMTAGVLDLLPASYDLINRRTLPHVGRKRIGNAALLHAMLTHASQLAM
jgi:hypothetical protein